MSEKGREAGADKPLRMGEDGAGVRLEDPVQAMSLNCLGEGDEARGKLRALGFNGVAECHTKRLDRHSSMPETVWRGKGLHPEPGVDATTELAKLCNESRLDKAYQEALWAYSRQTGNGEGCRTLEGLVQEDTVVYGSEFGTASKGATCYGDGESLSPIIGLCSSSPLDGSGPGGGSAAGRIQGSQGSEPSGTEGTSSPPSSLRTVATSWTSYPSHLEVSLSGTALFDGREANRDVQDPRSQSPQMGPRVSQALQETTSIRGPPSRPGGDVSPDLSPAQTQVSQTQRCPLGEKLSASASLPVAPRGYAPQQRPLSLQPGPARVNHVTSCAENAGSLRKAMPEPDRHPEWPSETTEPSPSTSASLSEDFKSESQGKHSKRGDEDEEEEEFFSFVILHSPEDVELAERLREKLEGLDVGPGATFSQDFDIPGEQRLTCVNVAIDNSAFVILLLSQNFDSRMLEFESNCALSSSLEKSHKSYNVIPLLPSKNRLPREKIPASLRIYVPLEEGGRGFEKKARKAMAPDKIERQKRVWRQERRIRAQEKRESRVREDNERRAALLQRTELVQEQLRLKRMLLDQQKMLEHYHSLLNAQPGQVPAPPYPLYPGASIHIENASCIMIGNDSQMTVGMGGEKILGERGENDPSNEEQE